MLICKTCYDNEETKLPYQPEQNWDEAQKLHEQCEFCQQTTLCAEL